MINPKHTLSDYWKQLSDYSKNQDNKRLRYLKEYTTNRDLMVNQAERFGIAINKTRNKNIISFYSEFINKLNSFLTLIDARISTNEEVIEKLTISETRCRKLEKALSLFTQHNIDNITNDQLNFLDLTRGLKYHSASSVDKDLFLLQDIQIHKIVSGSKFTKKMSREEMQDKIDKLNQDISLKL